MSAEEAKHKWEKVNGWEEEIALLKTILGKTELTATIKWGAPVYTINGKNVVGLGGFKNYFTIWFFNGVFLSDPMQVLVNANEGVTKALRQWRFATAEEVDEKTVLTYLHEAIANEKAGKNIPNDPKSKTFVIPEILKTALAENQLTVTFTKFAPYKQYEFVEYIDTAKQEKTKRQRIEKILPLIKENIGLNDKYR